MNKISNQKNKYYKYVVVLFLLMIICLGFVSLMPKYSHHVILILGVGLFFTGIYLLYPYISSKKWKVGTATIVSINETWQEVNISEYTQVKYFYPEIKYEYFVNDIKYTAERVSYDVRSIWVPEVDIWGSKTNLKMRFWSDWLVGTNIDIFYDPKCFGSAVIINKLPKNVLSNYLVIIIVGAILIFIWSALTINGVGLTTVPAK